MNRSFKILILLWLCLGTSFANAQSYQKGEYFFDNDPGIGNATPISFTSTSDSLNLNLLIPTTALSEGSHQLFMRFQDTADNWSLAAGRSIYIYDNSNATSAQLISGEYFFDNDPGVGNGTAISGFSFADSIDLNLSIDCSNLSNGAHQLYYRFLDSKGDWSQIEGRTFTITDTNNANAANIVSGEYFFDSDPGAGNGIAISNISAADSLDLDLTIIPNGLANGAHQLYYRFLDSDGDWSQIEGKTFIISDTNNANVADIISGEYFFDSDPGAGNGIAIPNISSADSLDLNLTITPNSLSIGAHQLYYRFLDSDGDWSQIEGKIFFISDTSNSQAANIVSGEYFFNSDPGVGNGISIPNITAADSLDLNINLGSLNLPEGAHQLFYRFMDSLGNWSQIDGKIFNIMDTTNGQAVIVGGEYFFDTDSGMTTGTPIPNFTSADSLDLSLIVIPSGLSGGNHYLFFRFYDNHGTWSQISSDSIDILSCVMPTANFHVSNICLGDSISFIDSSSQVETNASYQWDIFNNQTVIDTTKGSFKYAPLPASTYTAQLIVDNGMSCIDTITKTYTVFPLPTINIGADTTICHNDSLVLNAGSFTSYLWNNSSTNASLTATSANTYWVEVTDSNQCSSRDSLTLSNYALPTINISGLNTSYCINNPSSILSATPQGGAFSGNGMIDSLFYPNIAGIGNHHIIYQYTDIHSCSNSDTVQTTVNALPLVTITSILNSGYCSSNDSILLTASPSGGSFSGAQINNANYLYLSSINSGQKSIIYQYTDANNCSNSDTVQTAIYINPVVNYTGLASSYCSNNAASLLIPNILGGTFQGSGITGNTFVPANSGSGQITIQYNYTDAHGCSDSITHSTTVSQAPHVTTLTATPNSFVTTPFITQFSPNVSNPSNYNWKWYFGDGLSSTDSTPTHQYYANGYYTVSLATQDKATGCSDTVVKANFVSCSGATPCNLGAKIWLDTLFTKTICPGDSFLLNTGAYNSAYTYQWLRNGIVLTNSGTNNFYAKQKGYYQVIISNGSCIDLSSIFFLNNHTIVQPIIQQAGTLVPCTGDSIKLFAATTYPNYSWSTGGTSSEIYIKTSGYYTLSVTNAQGCVATSQPLIVNASALPMPEICRVSVDSITNFNELSWKNNLPFATDSFKVYREGYINNQFDLIATVVASTNMSFIDQSSLPKNRYYRYRISAVDSCGVETPLSNYHKSIHLYLTAGLSNSWNLVWNHYQGRPSSTYQIYRGLDSSQMQLLTQLPSSIHSYTDFSAPSGNVYYQIKVIFSDSCTQSPNAPVVLTASSNLTNTSNAGGIGFETHVKEIGSISVFPNPNKGSFNLKFTNIKEGRSEIELFDVTGKRIYFSQFDIISGVNQKVNLLGLAKGMYFIRISQEGRILAKKVVVVQ